jgi:ElaB/YqjD/DUF883 family membrane-anchored ribosome-binding protein
MDAGQGELKQKAADKAECGSARIEREIDSTRARMDGTITRIQDKLSFRHLADEFGDMLVEGTGVGSRRVLQGIRKNPIPAGLVGLSVVWLLMDRSRARKAADTHAPMPQGVGFVPHRDTGRPIGERISQGLHQAGEVIQGAGKTVSSAVSTARHTAADLSHTIRETAADAGESLSTAASRARRAAESAGKGVVDTYEENPLIVGAVTFALGLIGGLLVPTTPVEDRLMGRTSRELKERARGLGEQAVEAGQKIASRVAEAAQQGVQGTGGIADRLASAAGSVANAAAEEIGRQAGSMSGSPDRHYDGRQGQDEPRPYAKPEEQNRDM